MSSIGPKDPTRPAGGRSTLQRRPAMRRGERGREGQPLSEDRLPQEQQPQGDRFDRPSRDPVPSSQTMRRSEASSNLSTLAADTPQQYPKKQLLTHAQKNLADRVLMSPQNIAAKVLALMSQNDLQKHPHFMLVYGQAQAMFLDGAPSRSDALMLAHTLQQNLVALNYDTLAGRVADILAQGYENPSQSLDRAIKVFNDDNFHILGIQPEEIHQFTNAAMALKEDIASGKILPSEHMREATAVIERGRDFLNSSRRVEIKLLKIVNSQTKNPKEKIESLSKLHDSISSRSRASIRPKNLVADVAMVYTEAKALSSIRSQFMMPKDTHAEKLNQTKESREQLQRAFASGITVEALSAHALAVKQLQDVCLPIAKLRDDLTTALLRNVPLGVINSNAPHVDVVDKYLASLLPGEKRTLVQALMAQMPLEQAINNLAIVPDVPPLPVPPENHPSHHEILDRIAEAKRSVEIFTRILVKQVAECNVRARAMVDSDDNLGTAIGELDNALTKIQTPLTVVNDNVYGRAFESILSAHLMTSMPQSTKETWGHLGRAMANSSAMQAVLADKKASKSAAQVLRHAILKVGNRPWERGFHKAWELHTLAKYSDDDLWIGINRLLNDTPNNPHDVIFMAKLIRDTWFALSSSELNKEFVEKTNRFYLNEVSPRTGRFTPNLQQMRARNLAAPEGKRIADHTIRATTGIMSLHHPVPAKNRNARPSSAPGLLNQIDINNEHVGRFLRQGGVTVSGVSGSVNILVHFAEYAKELLAVDLQNQDIFLGASLFVVHDGGHSFHEALWVQDNFNEKRNSFAKDGIPPQSYAEMKEAFAQYPEVQRAFDQSIQELAKVDQQISDAQEGSKR